MKYSLDIFFDDLKPDELDEIMPDNLSASMPKKAKGRLKRGVMLKTRTKSRNLALKIAIPAVCAAISLGIGGYAIAEDAREYNSAVEFFEANGLSSEGLNRADLKAVYRDITTNSFTNGKTAEVFRNSIEGTEILQSEPSPDELEFFWNTNVNANAYAYTKETPVKYSVDYVGSKTGDDHEKVTVKCEKDGAVLWTADFPNFGTRWEDDDLYVEQAQFISGKTAVIGSTVHYREVTAGSKSNGVSHSFLTMIDNSGNKLWTYSFDHGFDWEYVYKIVENGDHLICLGVGDNDCLFVTELDKNGNEVNFKKTKIDGIRDVRNAVKLGSGYLAQIWTDDGERLVKIDADGNVTENYFYESDDCDYSIVDMAEFEGEVYLSAYSFPKGEGGGYAEYSSLREAIASRNSDQPLDVTEPVRDFYTAVLLICDPNGGKPETFWAAKNALGGDLDVSDGKLIWDVKSIVNAGISPYTGSFFLVGNCKVYRYTFDASGKLTNCEDTGKYVPFAR